MPLSSNTSRADPSVGRCCASAQTSGGQAVRSLFGWLLCILSTVAAIICLWLSYGYTARMTKLVVFGALVSILLWQWIPLRKLAPPSLPWCAAAAMTVLALFVDVLFESRIFLWKHAHTNLFLGGANFVESRELGQSQIQVFDASFADPKRYALKGSHAFFPEYADLPDTWHAGDPLPADLQWTSYRR